MGCERGVPDARDGIVSAWLRRVLRRPPTIADCIRAAMRAPCEPLRAPDPHSGDPYSGVVSGPELVERTLRNRAQHHALLADDGGFPDIEWGPYVNPYDEGDAA